MFHGLRSRSRSRCKLGHQQQVATPRPSTESRDSSSSVSSSQSTHSRSSVSSYKSAESAPPVPPLPSEYQRGHARTDSHPSIALFPFLANLPRFSALPGEDIDLWLHAIDTIAQHVGAPHDAPVPLIPLLLRGDAFKRFVRMHHETRGRLTSWDAWKEHLRVEFRSANYLASKREELAKRMWRSSETLAFYFDQRRKLQIVALPDATEDELVEDMLSGIPLRQRRLVVDTIPHAQRLEPTLAVLRRAMVDCEVEMRGRNTLRGDRLEITRRMHSTSPGPHSPIVTAPPSSFPQNFPATPAPSPGRGRMPPPPTISVSG
ncbi:hypothetical protein EXIGLDRAFT_834536 [Exidia glandulosa HHB12029]|uniref:Retrotransposon gag domain-containing protein n=1 Tax=Exidia glandulosa HHB12029 TaxID=1314781 RepID=A0A165JME2_EXIGL|nr:hypothetical protein EXIGLDRAFT_838469 [Exidia glandulosa HHB12029]KZV95060.1 hypothetical protein EXIGLDRAFT_834536 [Exidia glandulosa HHB12029]